MSETQAIDGQQTDPSQLEPGGIAALREAARNGEAASKENLDLKRQVFFMRAGVDLESEIGGMLFKTWDDGEDLEKLKEKWTRLSGTTTTNAAPAKTPAEIEAEQRQAADEAGRQAMQLAMSSTGQPAGQQFDGPHPIDAALEGYQAAIRRGDDEDIARQNAMGQVLAKAGFGEQARDPRLVFDQVAHNAAAEEADRAATRGGGKQGVWLPA